MMHSYLKSMIEHEINIRIEIVAWGQQMPSIGDFFNHFMINWYLLSVCPNYSQQMGHTDLNVNTSFILCDPYKLHAQDGLDILIPTKNITTGFN